MVTKPARPLRTILLLLVVAVLAQPLAACGKRGTPKASGDKPVTYPKTYPTN